MKKIINLKPEDYYRQDNNKILPGEACMPTARAMFYLGNKIDFSNPSETLSDDDAFMELLRSPEAYKFAEKHFHNLISEGYAPNEIHDMYPLWLDSIVVGKQISDFRLKLSFDNYIDRIKDGQVIMTSGEFKAAGLNGHAFCIIGAIIPESAEPSLILADPYGDYRENYKTGTGYAVVMSHADFIEHVKPAGEKRKWGHVKI